VRRKYANTAIGPSDVVDTYRGIGRIDDAIAVLRADFVRQPTVHAYRSLLDFAATIDRGDTERAWALDHARELAGGHGAGSVLVQLYRYDYGDNWELTLRLEEVLLAESDCPAAVVVDGERAAPPEDCGHLVDAYSPSEVLPDPALFEPERVNKGFGDANFVLREAGIDVRRHPSAAKYRESCSSSIGA
jgi:Plasmid pRiA4b ORF-3-like protein